MQHNWIWKTFTPVGKKMIYFPKITWKCQNITSQLHHANVRIRIEFCLSISTRSYLSRVFSCGRQRECHLHKPSTKKDYCRTYFIANVVRVMMVQKKVLNVAQSCARTSAAWLRNEINVREHFRAFVFRDVKWKMVCADKMNIWTLRIAWMQISVQMFTRANVWSANCEFLIFELFTDSSLESTIQACALSIIHWPMILLECVIGHYGAINIKKHDIAQRTSPRTMQPCSSSHSVAFHFVMITCSSHQFRNATR